MELDERVPGHLRRRIESRLETTSGSNNGKSAGALRPRTAPPSKEQPQGGHLGVAEPDGPGVFHRARNEALEWKHQQEQAWKATKDATFNAKVSKEHERLTHVFMGPEGLDPQAWHRLPRKLELLARRNVQRLDALDKQRRELNDWDVRPKMQSRVHELNAGMRSSAAAAMQLDQGHHEQEDQEADLTDSNLKRAYKLKHASSRRVAHTMASMRVELAASICNRMRMMGVHGGTLLPEDAWLAAEEDEEEEEQDEDDGEANNGEERGGGARQLRRQATHASYDESFKHHLAEDMKANVTRHHNPRQLVAQVSRMAAASTYAASSMTLKLQEEEARREREQEEAQGPGAAGAQSGADDDAGSLAPDGLKRRTSLAGSATLSQTGSNARAPSISQSLVSLAARSAASRVARGSTARRQSALARAAKKATLSPIVQSYHDACMARGVYISPEVATQLVVSENTKELKLMGVALPDAVAATIGDVLLRTAHLQAITFSRTVLNRGALAALLPACGQLRLHEASFVTTDMASDCWPHLLEVLQRPTVSMSPTPSEWWMTLRRLNLAGNPLGDQGMAMLAPALTELQALTHLDLSQAGITDWSAPLLEDLIRGTSGRLQSLSLAHNQLGALCGRALAGTLPTHQSLTSLDVSWNPLGGGVALVAWGLLAPRAKRQSRLAELHLCGVDLQSDDHLALAALLKWGHAWLPLTRLDISHNNMLGVAAQCLMRQLDAVLPCPARKQHTSSAAAMGEADTSTSPPDTARNAPVRRLKLEKAFASAAASMHPQAGRSATGAQDAHLPPTPGGETERSVARKALDLLVAGRRRVDSDPALPASGGAAGWPGTATNGVSDAGFSSASQPRHRSSIYDARRGQSEAAGGSGGKQQAKPSSEAAGRQQQQGLLVVAMGCRVDVDGGQAPTPRVRLDASDTSPGAATGGLARSAAAAAKSSSPAASSRGNSAAATDGSTRASWLLRELDSAAQIVQGPAQQKSATLPPAPLKGERQTQRFVLDLGTPRPDHFVAQLLVEHELDARKHRCMAWQHVQLDEAVYRTGGRDVRPFDVLYAGWAHPGVLPDEGTLVLDVACLPEHASSWLSNSRLHFNAARLQAQQH